MMSAKTGIALAVAVLISVFLLAGWTGTVSVPDRATIDAWIAGAGLWGPVLVIGLMTLAIVASPLPSAPIALAAGAAYGHFAGAAYVALGSELGAMIAFLLARGLGRDAVERRLGDKARFGLLGSQNALTLTVFSSRLLPFVSFDAVSYAAGLSRIHLWRFLLATLAGILPASFVLAHFGAEAASGQFGRGEWIALGLGLLTAAPILLMTIERRRQATAMPKPGHDG